MNKTKANLIAATGGVGDTLRTNARWRILNDMFEKVREGFRKEDAGKKDYLILIVDPEALKVFSSCCKFFELYAAGIYHVELLGKARKKFPQTHAIYFVSPSPSSIKLICNDFSSGKNKKKKDEIKSSKPQYGGVHLCFTSSVP
jgi:hypothetical protein